MEKLQKIANIIKSAAEDAGLRPGVYKMINAKGEVIYVGKAKYLKNRLTSYSVFSQLSNRTKMMVSNIDRIEFIIVNSEVEALLLESNLIKQFKPFYNVLLKDDKTFPYIVIDTSHEFPRVFKYRTLKPKGKDFYGPYPAISSLDETIKVIQKAFLVRNCTDNNFNTRKRPCLQYFIKRCSAPCVQKISLEDYSKNLKLAKDLLLGKDEIARKDLVEQMNAAAEEMDFEKAATLRDRIKAITEIQSKQYIQTDDWISKDFIAISKNSAQAVAAVTFFRSGKNVGTETFVLNNSIDTGEAEILESFITQFYKNNLPPALIVTEVELPNVESMTEFLKLSTNTQVKILPPKLEIYKQIISSCKTNAITKLKQISHNQYADQLAELKRKLAIPELNRIETYDNSHLQGTNACGIMVVFENGAFQKNKARKFNIDQTTANGGDDLEMMKFTLTKRFKSKSIKELPDLIVIDGGKTQLSAALEIRDQFAFSKPIAMIGIAKQNNRKMGDEKLIFEDGEEIILGRDNPLLGFLIMLRNEAHKTAISFHRKKRTQNSTSSILDQIPHIGKSRKKILLNHFASIDLIKNASINDLKMVKGIDSRVAEIIYNFFKEVK